MLMIKKVKRRTSTMGIRTQQMLNVLKFRMLRRKGMIVIRIYRI